MISYSNQPASLDQRSVQGDSLVLFLIMWLAMCLLEIAIFEVDTPLKRIPHQSKPTLGTCITKKI